jgi:asparagine synthase (glutamine-hydrolysing)
MCGILGWFSERQIDPERLAPFSCALHTMEKRGPDDWGIAALSECGTQLQVSPVGRSDRTAACMRGLLGHRRLSIIDLSPAGHQPMSDRDGRTWITYNGEVFNYVELREELKGLGHAFATQTDTEVILASYRQWGEECFSRFNGMWGMAIVDLAREVVILSRDHFGIKPAYYVQSERGLFFGSTIRSILDLSGIPRRANAPVLYDFLISGKHTCGAGTYFEGVNEVPAAHFAVFSLREPTAPPSTERWWKIGRKRIESRTPERTFCELFEDAIRIRLRSDVCVGSCLSGGLDSPAIVTGVTRQLAGAAPFRTVTCCYDGEGYDEEKYARQVVAATGSIGAWPRPLKTHRLLDDLPHLVHIQEKPFATLSVYSQYCVMREAKDAGVTVLLDGQGGDELLLGYDSCQTVRLALMMRRCQFGRAWRFAREVARNNALLPRAFLLPMTIRAAITGGRTRLLNRAIRAFLNPSLVTEYRERPKASALPSSLLEFRYGLVEEAPLPPLLHHEDRNSMAFSIETRLPLLDYRLADFVFNLEAETLMEKGWSKIFLRRYLDRQGLKEVAWRRDKMGYSTPGADMMDKSRAYLRDVCRGDLRSERFMDGAKLTELVDRGPFEAWHWRLISTELWMQSMRVS